MPDEKKPCACSAAPKLIFACSGAADVGEITDLAARRLTARGVGKMFCTAGIGGRVAGIIKTAEVADRIVALDGCALDCVKLSLEAAGFSDFEQVRVTDLGMNKGASPANEERVEMVAQAVAAKLG